jgi:hypothetical protein
VQLINCRLVSATHHCPNLVNNLVTHAPASTVLSILHVNDIDGGMSGMQGRKWCLRVEVRQQHAREKKPHHHCGAAQVRIKIATSQARLADPWGCARARPATLGDCFGMRCLMFGIFTYFRLFYIIIYCTVPSQKSVIKPSERLANSILPHLCIVITRSAFDTRLQRGRSKRRETALNH